MRFMMSAITEMSGERKDTSLAFVVGVPELTMVAGQVNDRELVHPLEIYLCCGALYFLLCAGLGLAARWLERALQPGRGGPSRRSGRA
jgi:polar amino acid transport system permease protein